MDKVVWLLALWLLVCYGRNHECAMTRLSIQSTMNSIPKKAFLKKGEYCGVRLAFASHWKVVTWLILPVVICLSQRLSHACLSINKFVLWNCEWLIKSVIVYLMITYYMDNCGNSRANTCIKQPRLLGGVYLLDKKPTRLAAPLVIHNNLSNRMALCRRCIIQISALSTFDGRIVAYHGFNG